MATPPDDRGLESETSIDQVVGERIVERRRILNLGRGHLAQLVGLSAEALRSIEEGQDRPQPDTLLAISKVLGVHVGYFFFKTANGSDAPAEEPRQRYPVGVSAVTLEIVRLCAELNEAQRIALLGQIRSWVHSLREHSTTEGGQL